jgi:hypothetical protein
MEGEFITGMLSGHPRVLVTLDSDTGQLGL